MCEVKRHCFDFYRENDVPNSVIELARDEIHLNRNLIEEFDEAEIHPKFNRALCESKIDDCYKVLNFRARRIITDWYAIKMLVDIHEGRKE